MDYSYGVQCVLYSKLRYVAGQTNTRPDYHRVEIYLPSTHLHSAFQTRLQAQPANYTKHKTTPTLPKVSEETSVPANSFAFAVGARDPISHVIHFLRAVEPGLCA